MNNMIQSLQISQLKYASMNKRQISATIDAMYKSYFYNDWRDLARNGKMPFDQKKVSAFIASTKPLSISDTAFIMSIIKYLNPKIIDTDIEDFYIQPADYRVKWYPGCHIYAIMKDGDQVRIKSGVKHCNKVFLGYTKYKVMI